MNRRKFFHTTLSTTAGALLVGAIGVTTTPGKAAAALPTHAECVAACNGAFTDACDVCTRITLRIPREMCFLAAYQARSVCVAACGGGAAILNVLVTAEEIAAATAQWIRDHPFATAGTVVVIFGAVYVVTVVASGGTAGPVLALVLAA